MKKAILLISILFSAAAFSCKEKSANQKAADQILDQIPDATRKNLNVGKKNYLLDVPKGWKTSHPTYKGINYYFLFAPKTKDDPNTSVNVVSEYMQNLSLAEYMKATIQSIKKVIPTAVLLDEGEITANGIKGNWYSYSMAQAGVKASIVSYVFPKDGIAYVITGGTQLKDAERYRPIFDSVAQSFRFND